MDENEDNQIKYDKIENLIDLSEIDEDNVLQVLKSRYEKELIYTFIGNILVAINPYRPFDIYGINEVKKYENQVLGTLPAHLFAIGSAAVSKLIKDNENQLFIVCGESGSGKTESIKLILQYLAAVNKSPSNIITEQILESNPLLETFGNAKTIKNNNSSRFGKYLEIYFKNDLIIGANVKHFLLEKPRIVSQLIDERNYHIFYEILAGFTPIEKEKYGLQSADKYFYLNQGSLEKIEGKDDAQDFSFLLSSFQILGFTNEQQDCIFRILASVLHLGNIYFHRKFLKTGQEGVEVGSDVEIRWGCHLLQLNIESVLQTLTCRITETRGERIYTPYNIDQALDARDAIAKTLYDCLFTWLMIKLNEKTNSNLEHKNNIKTIAMLDFFGFENLNENSFEQLCINMCNEKLHQHFIQFVFKLEQQEYAKEKIECETFEFVDNIQVINLLIKKPLGIFPLLDDECNFPKATDQSFLDKCHYNHALNHEIYARPRMSSFDFGIKHYSGVVWYSADGFLDKNRDTLKNDVIELLISSKMTMVSKMFTQYKQSIELSRQNTLNLNKNSSFKNTSSSSSTSKHDLSRFTQMKPRTPTISARFQESLSQLYQKIVKINNVYYICCLKPNEDKKPLQFDDQLILEQMNNINLVSIVRARKAGFPIKKRFCEFVSRYRCLVKQSIDKNKTFKEICELLLDYLNIDLNLFRFGISKVFLKEKLENHLELKRERLISNAVIKIQSNIRGYLQRSNYKKIRLNIIKIQSTYRGYKERKIYLNRLKSIIKIQSKWKMIKQKREFKNMLIILKQRKEEELKKQEKERIEHEIRNESLNCLSLLDLEIELPEQLDKMLINLNKLNFNRSSRNIHKLTSEQQFNFKFCKNQLRPLPSDIDQFSFSKFTNIYFNSHLWAMKKEPIKTSFLLKNSNFEVKQSLNLFKLVLKFMNDNTLTEFREKVFLDFIINSALKHDYLRDELLCQLCNQTWKNENQINVNRGWILMINCLSSFSPSSNLFKYLLKYLSDNANDFRGLLQQKLLNSEGQTRKYPPTYLEWIANSKKANMALNFTYPNNEKKYCEVNSWSTGESIASDLLSCKGVDEKNSFGWSIDLEQDDQINELNGEEFLFDLINEVENPLISNYDDDFYIYNQFENGNEELPLDTNELINNNNSSNENNLMNGYLNGHLNNRFDNLSLDNLINKNEINIQRHHSLGSINEQIVLSKNSKLNKRYLLDDKDVEESLKFSETSKLNKRYTTSGTANTSSTSNLQSPSHKNNISIKTSVTGGVASKLNKQQSMQQHSMSNLIDIQNNSLSKRSMSLQELGLATNSALNDRYFDKNTNKSNSLTKKEIKQDLSSLNSSIVSTSSNQAIASNNNVKPKVMSYSNLVDLDKQPKEKSQITKSSSSYWYKEKFKNQQQFGNYLNIKHHHHHHNKVPSSAMSDVSEASVAPSLASHVKGVKLPSHASESIDQYLDELFNPVLDGNLDELSDIRSLAASIKGGGNCKYDDQLNSKFISESEDSSIETDCVDFINEDIQPNQIKKLSFKEFKDFCLANKDEINLCQLIKGGETKDSIAASKTQQKVSSTINTSINSSLSISQTETIDNSQNNSQLNAFTNVAGMTVPMVDTSQVIQQQLVHQQMIQRAFLASAVQQNLQIQQQLLKQNQALQQLLSTDSSEINSSNPNSLVGLNPKLNSSLNSGLDSTSTDETLFPVPLLQTVPQLDFLNNIQSDDNKKDDLIKEDQNKKEDLKKSNEKIKILSNKQLNSHNCSVPAPPPLPISPSIAYGSRAKTVRIGKVRWPPNRQEGDGCETTKQTVNKSQTTSKLNETASKNENDLHNKELNIKKEKDDLMQQSTKHQINNKDDRLVITELRMEKNSKLNLNVSMINMSNNLINSTNLNNMNKRSLSTNGINQQENKLITNSNVGKLRISSEMKAKLELLTINQSVRSTVKSSNSNKNDLMAKSMENLQDIRENNRSVNKLSKERKTLLEKQLLGQFNPVAKVNSVDNLTNSNQLNQQLNNQKKLSTDNYKLVQKSQNYSREKRERNDELGPSCGLGPHHKSLSALNYCYDCKRSDESNCKFYCREHFEFDQLSTSMCNITDFNNEQMNNKLNKFNNQLNLTSNQQQTKYETLFGDNLTNLESGQFLDTNYLKQNGFNQSNNQLNNQLNNEKSIKINNKLNTKLYPIDKLYLAYQKVSWELRLRKELFSPTERIDSPLVLNFIFLQIIKDAFSPKCLRMRPEDRQKIIQHLNSLNINKQNYLNQQQKLTVQKTVVQMARQMPLYFCRFYSIINCENYPEANQLAVSHNGLRLVKRTIDQIKIIENFCFEDIIEITSTKDNYIQILGKNNTWLHLISDKASQIKSLIEYFIVESLKDDTEFVKAIADFHSTSEPTLLNFKKGDIIAIAKNRNSNLKIAKDWYYGIHKTTGESGLISSKYVVPLNLTSKSSMNQFELNEQVSEDLKSASKVDSTNLKENSQSWIENKNENLIDSREEEKMKLLANNDYVKDSLDLVSGSENNQNSILSDGKFSNKFSLLQFALFNFVEAIDKYELIQETKTNQTNGSNQIVETLRAKKNKKKNSKNGSDKDWTWKELSDLVKYTNQPLNQPLLKHSHNSLNKISLECFTSIMKYMGDLKLNNDQTEVDSVYNILVNCHKHIEIRDEVYCQLMKQTTNNKSFKPDSCLRGWRLFSIVTSYFDCSDNLRPYLFKYLETTAYDKRRAYHATALVCLQNFRKTLRFGGRKNVPSVEEILAITAGRNSKRQMYRLPGGTEKVISAKSSTVVNDVIEEICQQLNVYSSIEQQEFSLYCIVEGDPYTMPINRDEYILDITTELIKNGQIFYLIFCRSVWYFNLKLDSPLYIEVIFNQLVPDFLEGLLLVLSSNKSKSNQQDQQDDDLQNGKLTTDPNANIFSDFTLSDQMVNDISRIASLLHRAADMENMPTKQEVQYLLPKPVLPMKFMKPAKWVELVQAHWQDMSAITTMEAKAQCLDCLSKWSLFGSCFFAIKHCIEYNSTDFPEYILALNRNGAYFLDIISHETIFMFAYIDIISTRKVRAEDGTLFLDLKCGNLMQQKVTRIQTDQAHEISRLIKQYIEIQNHSKKNEQSSTKNQFIQDV